MQIYNDEHLYHFGIKGMHWGKGKKGTDFYNKQRNKDQKSNILEKQKLRDKYDNGKISYDDYVKQNIQLGRTHIEKSLNQAKTNALSTMSDNERKIFEKTTVAGKKQADMLLEKIARGGQITMLDKLSMYGYK